MKKFLASLLTVLSMVTLAHAHMNETFHAHPHGAKLNPGDTTMLIISICIVMAMIIIPIIILIITSKKR
ncbi:MAG: hypothetical protein HGA36_02085 [Candidatus Moranbacteria bacterium]|nr:hypothetical protein [Candidatus Moranbacteria bacterium]